MSPELTLRRVRPDESEALAALWHAGWQTGHTGIVPDGLIIYRTIDSFRTRVGQSLNSCYVAEAETGLVGFVRLKGDELDQFYVAPDMIGAGIARPLMRAAEALMARLGVTRAFLIAAADNHRAIRFYEKCGWEDMGVMTASAETSDGPFDLIVVRLEKTLT